LNGTGRYGEMSVFTKLILRVCLLHPVFLSDVLSDVIGVIIKYNADSALSNCQSNSAWLNTCVFSKAENVGLFYDPPGKYPSDTQQCRATGDKMTAVV